MKGMTSHLLASLDLCNNKVKLMKSKFGAVPYKRINVHSRERFYLPAFELLWSLSPCMLRCDSFISKALSREVRLSSTV